MKTEILPAPAKPGEPTLERAFHLMAEQINKRGQVVQRIVMAHVRAKTGKNLVLPLLHKDPAFTEDFKKALYLEITKAVVSGDYSKLAGDVAQGDKQMTAPVAERPDLSHDADCAYRLKGECTCGKDQRTVEAVELESKRATQPTAEPPENTTRAVKPAAVVTLPEPVLPVKRVELNPLDPISAAMLTAMAPHLERIIDERITHAMSNGAFPVERVKELVSGMLQQAVTPSQITPEILAALQSLLTAIQHSLTGKYGEAQ